MSSSNFSVLFDNRPNTNVSDYLPKTTQTWTVEPILLIIVAVLAFTTNSVTLNAVLRDRAHRSSFHVFVTFLLLINVISTLLHCPFAIIINVHGGDWPLSNDICSFYLFFLCILSAACTNAHALIAVNRTWAIIHPLSYRIKNSPKLSIQTCIGLVIYILLFMVPFWALDVAKYRLPIDQHGCQMNVVDMQLYGMFIGFLTYLIPLVLILTSVPVVCVAKLVRGRRGVFRWLLGPANSSTDSSQPTFPIGSAAAKDAKTSRKYLILALMTCSILVCYFPATVVYVLAVHHPEIYLTISYKVICVLYHCQILLDPVWLMCSWDRLRHSVVRFVCPRKAC